MDKKAAAIKETDLYPPLKAWLEANGYAVRAEVRDCDIVARRGDELVLVEMKRAINLDLLLQVVRRQEADASVYAAVPAPRTVDRRWRELTRLLKRIEAGLIVVYLRSALPRAEVVFHPFAQERRKTKAATRAIISEAAGRTIDMNVGGSTRRAIVTAYREQALRVAAELRRLGPASPAQLRAAGLCAKTGSILYANHYGWFEHPAPGVYRLTAAGLQALDEYRELVETFAVADRGGGAG